MNKMIILSVTTIAMLTFSGCGDKSKEEGTKSVVEVAKDAASKAVDATKETASKAVEATKEAASSATEAVKETAQNAADATKEAASKAVEATKEAASSATEAVKETAQKAADATKEAASATVEKAKEAATGGNEKGKAVFAKCVSCHGVDGKTKALGKSEIIAGQAAADIEKKLQEYKAGTRNVAGMGMLMKGQAGPLSDEEIKAVAEYISSLK